jgi:Uma2 family endonuclease
MAVMAETRSWLPEGRPFTVDDLDFLPDDGNRYELLDGMLVVSPAPRWAHQEVQRALTKLLHAARPADLRVVPAPFEWRPSERTALQPDILVARYDDLVAVPDAAYLVEPPLLAVEVLSPTNRHIDRLSKLSAYEDAGVPSYWLVEPDRDNPSVTAMELVEGRYAKVAYVVGDGGLGDAEWTAERPFAVTVRPADLVAELRP